MKRIKLFEDFEEEGGFITVPPDFDKRLSDLADDTKQNREFYEVPLNQIKIDLFYGLKNEIRNFLEDSKSFVEKTQEEYERRLNREIDGVLYKFSGGKYNLISKDDIEEIKEILWVLINERIPYDQVDYYYTYDLRGKLMSLLDEFIIQIKEKL